MLEELNSLELFLAIVVSTIVIAGTVVKIIKHFNRKNIPIISHIYHSIKRNYLVFTIITNVDYAVTIKKVRVKLTTWKSRKLGFGTSSPNNEEHSHSMALLGVGKVPPIVGGGNFNIYLPKYLKPEDYKFIIYTDAGKIKKVYKV